MEEQDKELFLKYMGDFYKGLDKNGDSVVTVEEYRDIFN